MSEGDSEPGFFVEDDGPRIEDDYETIFTEGYSAAQDGTGLELSIVDAHDWSVRVHDGRSGGHRFEFTDVREADDGRDVTADPDSRVNESNFR